MSDDGCNSNDSVCESTDENTFDDDNLIQAALKGTDLWQELTDAAAIAAGGGSGGGGGAAGGGGGANDGRRQDTVQNLSEVAMQLEDSSGTMPDSVIAHILSRSGFQSSDPRLVRLISLAGQKFITDIATDALHHSKMRATAHSKKQPKVVIQCPSFTARNQAVDILSTDKKLCMTLDDLTPALAEYGIAVRKPPYLQ